MSAIQHSELQIWFLWWKVFCRKLQLHMWLRISRHPRWVKLGTLLKTSERKQRENSLAKARVQKEKPKKIKEEWKHGPHKHTKRDHEEKARTWVWDDLFEMAWKKRGMQGHPQACGFASSCPLLLPHHVMYLISVKEIFSSPWYSNTYKMVSSPNKWYNSFKPRF